MTQNQVRYCPECGGENRLQAKYCKHCKKTLPLSPNTTPSPATQEPISNSEGVIDLITNTIRGVKDLLGLSKTPPTQVSETRQNILSGDRTKRVPHMVKPKKIGERISYFQILDVRAFRHSNYYITYRFRCLSCGHENTNPGENVCANCKAPMQYQVLRETAALRITDETYKDQVKNMSKEIEGVLQHLEIFTYQSEQYIILDNFPKPWSCLAERLPINDPETAITLISQIGQTLKRLHAAGYAFYDDTRLSDLIEPILILKNGRAYIADLTSITRLTSETASRVQKDILYLSKVLYTLVTRDYQGITRASAQLLEVPAPFRDVLELARSGKFPTIDAFLNALQAPQPPELARSLRQLVGYATDVGIKRDHNEDYVSKFSYGLEQIPGTPEIGLYVVADGMGGHQAGEKASEEVIRVVVDQIQEKVQDLQDVPKIKRNTIRLDQLVTPQSVLKQAIERANQVLLEARYANRSDRGTTITAALVVGETCAVANVGDSRTYLMRDGRLEQITTDHSLVASLVAAGMIKPNEVRSHPQRSQIYRTLGDKPNIEIDLFQRGLKPGDRLLLCSDGLWEMVLDDIIAKILRSTSTPQAACDRLIEAANTAGGDDNISIIIVWLE